MLSACDDDGGDDGGVDAGVDAGADGGGGDAGVDAGADAGVDGGVAELPPVQLETLSNRADLVSGGDALVEVILPAGATAQGLRVEAGGRDVSNAFAVRADGRITGLVTGLSPGQNVLTARTDTAREARLTVTNASRGGPILSGAQQVPFVCATPTPQPATATTPATNASGLSTAATDAQCNIATEYKLYYRTTTAGCSLALPDPSPSVPFTSTNPPTTANPPANPCFKPYTPGPAPADLATVTTEAGVTVPYIVRVERGTMNRGIYDLAVLFDPSRSWSATDVQPQWTGKLLYQFGGGSGQPRRQVRPSPAWSSADAALARGYLVAANSMTDSATNSNKVVTAETVMMMKEHVSDSYGPLRFTLGTGCSGGSLNSHVTATIAPGQLDGFTVSCTYPDSETTSIEVSDCVLLVEAYQKQPWVDLMASSGLNQAQVNAKKAAINGHPDQTGCHGWFNAFGSLLRTGNYVQRLVLNNATGAVVTPGQPTNNCQLPAATVYDAQTNPGGTRCSPWDWAASVFGKGADGVRVLDTRDNTGVQYGLKALLSDAITAEEFVVLNEIVGGADKDGNLQAPRTEADAQALALAYRAGLVTSGRSLARAPIIDMRGWDDSALVTPPGATQPSVAPIHFVWRSFSVRDRLDKEFGDHGNQVLWRFGRTGLQPPAAVALEALVTMDRWLTALKADTSSSTLEAKVRATKPAAAFDYCLLSTDTSQSTKVTDPAACDADPFLKPSSSPRQVAGGPLSENILKCQLRPIDPAEYGGRLSEAQLTRLRAVFPDGVCDWSRPGVEQQPPVSPVTFSAGPGGQPLGAAPVAQPE